jgi:hypothetical protein
VRPQITSGLPTKRELTWEQTRQLSIYSTSARLLATAVVTAFHVNGKIGGVFKAHAYVTA